MPEESRKLKTNCIYQHFKGNYCLVLDVAKDSETLQDVVVYKELHSNLQVWVRPLQMFLETVEFNGKKVPRFKKVTIKDKVVR